MLPDGPAESAQDWDREEWEVATGGSDMLPDGPGKFMDLDREGLVQEVTKGG